jgi:hypothetical protein
VLAGAAVAGIAVLWPLSDRPQTVKPL